MDVPAIFSVVRSVLGLLAGAALLAGCGDGPRYAIGGSVSGLTGSGLLLAINGKETLAVPASGAFTFRSELADGAAYAVTVAAHPVGQGCVVTHAAGAVAGVAVSDILVACSVAAPMTVIDASPAFGATAVARSSTPTFTFSAALGAATVTTANIGLESIAGSQLMTTAAAGNMLSITPRSKLLPLTAYTATVGTAVRGANGEQLTAAAISQFTTRDGAWQAPQLHSGNENRDHFPRVAMDAQGNALLVWVDEAERIQSSSYRPATGWGAPVVVGTGTAPARDLQMDAHGNAMAVWEKTSGANCGEEVECERYTVQVRRYTPQGGWGNAKEIASNVSSGSTHPRLALDAEGNAVVVWAQVDGSQRNIRARRYSAQHGWSNPETLESADGNADYPAVALDADGNAIALWAQFDGARESLWSSRHTPAGGWSAPELLETGDAGSVWRSWIAIDRSGDAVAVWQQSDGTRYNVWSNRYTAAGWGTAGLIETDDAGDVLGLDLAMDAQGNVVVVWDETDRAIGGIHTDVWANRYSANAGWDVATRLETDNTGPAQVSQVAVDAAGNALAVWSQGDGTRYNIWSRRLVAGGGWSPAVLIETDDAGDAVAHDLAVDGSGDAIAVWQVYGAGRSQVYSARFD